MQISFLAFISAALAATTPSKCDPRPCFALPNNGVSAEICSTDLKATPSTVKSLYQQGQRKNLFILAYVDNLGYGGSVDAIFTDTSSKKSQTVSLKWQTVKTCAKGFYAGSISTVKIVKPYISFGILSGPITP